MARLVITDKPKPRLEAVEPRTRCRITLGEVENGLGAERVGVVPPGGSPISAYMVRRELFRRLRSTGGRPGLEGADMKPKIPMRRSRWKKLEQLAKQVEAMVFIRPRRSWPRSSQTSETTSSSRRRPSTAPKSSGEAARSRPTRRARYRTGTDAVLTRFGYGCLSETKYALPGVAVAPAQLVPARESAGAGH